MGQRVSQPVSPMLEDI